MSKHYGLKIVDSQMLRLKNRRIIFDRLRNGDWGITWRRLEGRQRVSTTVRLSNEAALATAVGILKMAGMVIK
jgi:hypothetical protein